MSAGLVPAMRGTPARLVKSLAELVSRPGAQQLFPLLALEAATSVPWSSATFDGERHRLDVRLHGDAAGVGDALDRLVDGLAEHEFDLCGQIVAQARILRLSVDPDPLVVAVALTIEVLTVVD